MRKTGKNYLLLFLFTFGVMAPLRANGLSGFMQDSVATFFDGAKLLYYSFKSTEKKGQAKEDLEAKNPEQIKAYFKSRGVEVNLTSGPMSRESFAKALMKHFSLETSWSTSLFGWERLYFSDAQRLGIFPGSDLGTEALTTRDMVNAFMKAKNLKR